MILEYMGNRFKFYTVTTFSVLKTIKEFLGMMGLLTITVSQIMKDTKSLYSKQSVYIIKTSNGFN